MRQLKHHSLEDEDEHGPSVVVDGLVGREAVLVCKGEFVDEGDVVEVGDPAEAVHVVLLVILFILRWELK